MKKPVHVALLGLLAAACARPAAPVAKVDPCPAVVVRPAAPPEPPQVDDPQVRVTSRRLGKDTLGVLLARAQVPGDVALALVEALTPLLDPRRMRPVDMVGLRQDGATVVEMQVRRTREDGAPQTIAITRAADGSFTSSSQAAAVRVETARLSGNVQSTLYETMVAAGEAPSLINAFVDVFGSTVDFYREVQNGDAFKLIVEKRFAGDRFVGYGRVLAAEYKQTWRNVRGFLHTSPEGRATHFDEKGRSLQSGFLKTPMEFTRITSKFGSRFHPVLHAQKQHNGVDYGAPTGTPIWSVADGTVVSARNEGACGNAVMVQHANGLLTGYCHLSRFAAAMRAGVRVSQKQVIGYVGTTGRSTAPHLHFLMKRNGGFVNPQKIDVPRNPGLAGAELAAFQAGLPDVLAQLDAIPAA